MLQNFWVQQMSDDQNYFLERRLLNEIAQLERKIAELELERDGLKRVLTRVKRENLAAHEVGRRNSVDRVLIESRLLEYLRHAGRAVSSGELYNVAKNINPKLKETTFRSHLHRMKKKNMIANAKFKRGMWIAFDENESKI